MVAITSQGYQITGHGIKELEERGIPHRGDEVVADGVQKLDFGGYDPDDFVELPTPVPPVVQKPVKPRVVPKPALTHFGALSESLDKLLQAFGR